jgi:ligand-binding SRPBCC domain-containing protein
MVRIELSTQIAAPVERCFDLARSIELHMASTDFTGERAIAGVTTGLIGFQQTVTWKGHHFGVAITHTSRITEFEPPRYFQDCMLWGAFKSFCHEHYFASRDNGTEMIDVMQFEAPLGFLGRIAESLALERHMRNLLQRRNQCIRKAAESDEWKKYVSDISPIRRA